MSCTCAARHHAEMVKVWRGMLKVYRDQLAFARSTGAPKATINTLVRLVNKQIAKLKQPIEPCREET